jgi:hypothetical protein
VHHHGVHSPYRLQLLHLGISNDINAFAAHVDKEYYNHTQYLDESP